MGWSAGKDSSGWAWAPVGLLSGLNYCCYVADIRAKIVDFHCGNDIGLENLTWDRQDFF